MQGLPAAARRGLAWCGACSALPALWPSLTATSPALQEDPVAALKEALTNPELTEDERAALEEELKAAEAEAEKSELPWRGPRG